MSTILVVYSALPPFPATDQNPAAVRYVVGQYWVDAIGGAPTPTEVAAAVNPPDDTRTALLKADAGQIDMLDRIRTATPAQIDAWLTSNVTTLAQARTVLGTLIKVLALALK